ncbi:ABC-2 family transporter protein [Nocardioides dokdonensis FR1436]|uniref:ABC-2 family transporter protein n=1 Tax=Nocardioides dokdonensis FR1436 TaxID=1300347 RepID=A0A1A9GQS9_9ACTN|nr:hypothetical protein [Nocardioides dokdonensis]ANH39805.1 ABC-2 family transporter protein [Nocardioides dokdonensis FR1436]
MTTDGAFTGTLVLAVRAMRGDRWLVLGSGAALALLYWAQAWSIDRLYTGEGELARMAAAMERNDAMIALAGPARALDTVGGQVTWQASAFGAVLLGLVVMVVVTRHTRAEEESGRDDLVRSGAVGRFAPPAAAVLTSVALSVLSGLLVTLSLVVYPLDTADSLALGVGLTLCGLCFTGTTLVAAQLVASTRAARGIAGAVVAAAYALRAVGDVSVPALSWLSPIGWYQGMQPFSGLRWWPAVLLLGATVVNLAVAAVLLVRRDIGGGLVAARPGPPRAGRLLAGPVGLAWRLQRAGVLGWGVGLALTAPAYGALGTEVDELVGSTDLGRDVMTQGAADLVDGYFATMLLMLALLVTGFATASTLRPRAEEESGLAELVLATPLRRGRWLLAWTAVTLLGTALLLVVSGLGIGTGFALVSSDPAQVGAFVLPMLQYAPSVLVLAAVARLVHAAVPRRAALAWVPLGVAVVVMFFGELLDLPRWVRWLSPFDHLPLVPAEDSSLPALAALLAVALAVGVSAQFAFLRRDIG